MLMGADHRRINLNCSFSVCGCLSESKRRPLESFSRDLETKLVVH
jgi:hypothetical protein